MAIVETRIYDIQERLKTKKFFINLKSFFTSYLYSTKFFIKQQKNKKGLLVTIAGWGVMDYPDAGSSEIKTIEDKYYSLEKELESSKAELKNKQFDENNFNNVSMIKNQSKQIAEKDNKIKELESMVLKKQKR